MEVRGANECLSLSLSLSLSPVLVVPASH